MAALSPAGGTVCVVMRRFELLMQASDRVRRAGALALRRWQPVKVKSCSLPLPGVDNGATLEPPFADERHGASQDAGDQSGDPVRVSTEGSLWAQLPPRGCLMAW
jgi:hypothetical protein